MIKNFYSTKEQGFTLLEIVITIAISLVLLSGLMGLYEWHQKVYLQESASVMATSAVRTALLNMSKSIAQSSGIEASHDFSGTVYTTGGNSVVLELPSVNSSGDVIASTYDYIAFYLDDSSVYQITEAAVGSVRNSGTKLLSENVQIFSLTYNNGNPTAASNVTIDMQAVVVTRNSSVTINVSDTIFLRNL